MTAMANAPPTSRERWLRAEGMPCVHERRDRADSPPRGTKGPERAARLHQSSGSAAKSRLVCLYHAIPDNGFFHLPCISCKAPLCVSSPLATISFRWLSSALITSLAVFPWSGKSHGPPNCLHVMVFIGLTSFPRIRPTPGTARNG